MSSRKKSRGLIGVLLIFLLITGFAVIVGYFLMMRSVQAEFGQPSPNLSLTQRVIFPVELFINRNALTKPNSLLGAE